MARLGELSLGQCGLSVAPVVWDGTASGLCTNGHRALWRLLVAPTVIKTPC